MRHRVKGRKLNRTAAHRVATFRALATAILREKKIRTTVAKAKELRTFVEPIISRAKTDSVANRRNIARHIQDKDILKELFNEIAPKIGDRPGGYTRVVKLGRRQGDGAEMAIIELVDYNDVNSKPKAKKSEVKEEVIEDANVVEETVVEDVTEEEVVADETVTEEAVVEEVVAEEAVVEDAKVEEVKEKATEEVKAEEKPKKAKAAKTTKKDSEKKKEDK
jgi:large subunit ribosomal protein L17